MEIFIFSAECEGTNVLKKIEIPVGFDVVIVTHLFPSVQD